MTANAELTLAEIARARRLAAVIARTRGLLPSSARPLRRRRHWLNFAFA